MSKNSACIVKKCVSGFSNLRVPLYTHLPVPFWSTIDLLQDSSTCLHLHCSRANHASSGLLHHHIKIWQTCDRHLFDMSGVLLIGLKYILANSSVAGPGVCSAGEGEPLTGDSSTVGVRSFLRVALFGRCRSLPQDCTQSVSCGKCCSWWCLRKIYYCQLHISTGSILSSSHPPWLKQELNPKVTTTWISSLVGCCRSKVRRI